MPYGTYIEEAIHFPGMNPRVTIWRALRMYHKTFRVQCHSKTQFFDQPEPSPQTVRLRGRQDYCNREFIPGLLDKLGAQHTCKIPHQNPTTPILPQLNHQQSASRTANPVTDNSFPACQLKTEASCLLKPEVSSFHHPKQKKPSRHELNSLPDGFITSDFL